MKKIIIKTNQWYDTLPEFRRALFFLIVILGSLLISQYYMHVEKLFWIFPVWVLSMSGWRIAYIFIQLKDAYDKNTNNK